MKCINCGAVYKPSLLMSPRCDTCRDFEPHGFNHLNHQVAGGMASVPVLPAPQSVDVDRFPHSIVTKDAA